MKKAFLFFTILIAFSLPFSAHAQSLDQLVQQLREKPDDAALRERAIRQAQEEKPAIPEEARRHFVKGSAIAQSAKDAAGQKLAVQSFEEALKIAPWWSDAYYNLAVAQELAGDYSGARQSLQNYILTNPGGKEAREAQDRVYALEGKQDLAKTAAAAKKAAEDTPQKREEKFLKSLEGKIFVHEETYDTGLAINYARRKIAISNGEMVLTTAIWNDQQTPIDRETDRIALTGRSVSYNSAGDYDPACNPITLIISDDGSKITHAHTCFGKQWAQDYFRTN